MTELDNHKVLFIKERIRELRKTNPRLTFREAWNKVQGERPDWMASEAELPRSRDQFKSSAEIKTPYLDLLALARQMKIPVRVEASRGTLELSDEHCRLLTEYAEILGYVVEEV